MKETDMIVNKGVKDTLLAKNCFIKHDRSCGTEFIAAENLDKDSLANQETPSMDIKGTFVIPQNMCPKVFFAKFYEFLKDMGSDIFSAECIVYDEYYTIGTLSCLDCEHYVNEHCKQLSIRTKASYVFGSDPPEDIGVLWIDTNAHGGLKYYNKDEESWKHVPVFAVNAEDL